MEANLIKTGLTKIGSPSRVKGDGGVYVNVVFGPKSLLELTNGFQGFFQIQHGIPTGDARPRGVHGSTFLDDLFPRRAPSLVGKHVRRFTPIFGKRAIIATPMAFPGDKEHQFAALLALNATFRFPFLSGEHFGGHGQGSHHIASLLASASVNNQR